MADSGQDAAAGYIDAVKWIVGISSALLAGVFLHPELTNGWSFWGKVSLVLVLLLLGASIVGGVVYLLWLNRIRRRKERIAEIDREMSSPVVIPDAQRTQKLREEKVLLLKDEEDSKGTQAFWYWAFILTFLFGGAIGITSFCAQVVYGQRPKDDCKKDCRDKCCDDEGAATTPDLRRFTVVQSAVHKTAHGTQAHTFLVNQQTGDVWQMICDQKGNIVAFQRVKRLDLNGNPEREEAAKKP
ncbi:hypothetical protein [Edaphobacter modestus]|uniref:Uncharacterized protein n=1 Tax=Edaphobacter modestus TaxID=388466 RepID=A0A4Q7YYT9_9BACT|nr:hypothetical protein [Edaphobacter modestus]RZU42928.1 hypothetical protein BDD14_4529 [Edaphobacter modestus]